MITLDVKYYSESDYAEAQEFIKKYEYRCVELANVDAQTTEEECLVCKRFDEITDVCFDYPELNINDARKKCAVHYRDVAHGCA